MKSGSRKKKRAVFLHHWNEEWKMFLGKKSEPE